MLLLSLTLSLVLLGSSWGEWARTGPGFLPRGSGGGQAGLEGKQVDRVGKGKRMCQGWKEASGGQELGPGPGAGEGLGS